MLETVVGYLLWDVIVTLSPFIILWVIAKVGLKLNWQQLIGEGDILPWALPLNIFTIRRMCQNNVSSLINWVIVIFFSIMTLLIFLLACHARYSNIETSEGKQKMIKLLTKGSVVSAGSAIAFGIYIIILVS